MGREEGVKGERWMSLESAWGNCGKTAWKNDNKKRKGTKTTKPHKLKARSGEPHKRERADYITA